MFLPIFAVLPLAVSLSLVVQSASDVPAAWATVLASVAVFLPVLATYLTQGAKWLGLDISIEPVKLARWVGVGVWVALVAIGPLELPGSFGPMPTTLDPFPLLTWLAESVAVVGAQVGFISEGSRVVYDTFLRRG